jgi:hypothetical protein
MEKRKNKVTEQIDPAQLDSYFKERMHQIGVTDTGQHTIRVESLEYHGQYSTQPIFSETTTGNIEIHYPCLYGGPELIDGTETEFMRLRYHQDNQPDSETKYFQPPKSGNHIFFPPAMVAKFAAKEPIKTLYVVEGEFKAFAGSLQGLDIIGLGGMASYGDDDKKGLHPDILAIIHTCEVVNLVLLLDADVEHVHWDVENDPHKDLAKRLYNFYNSVIRWREYTKGHVRDAYFMHIQYEYFTEAKGLDDLLFVEGKDGHQAKVVEDLLKLTSARLFFTGYNVSILTPGKIKSNFNLNIVKGLPTAFYYHYENLIGGHVFNFSGARYQKASKGDGLEMVRHEDSFKFIRVGCDYIKIIHVPDAKGRLRRKLKGWKSGEITRDYVNNGFKNFYDTLEKYDEFCNVPCNTGEYKPIIENCYNMYYQLEHELRAGEWKVTEAYLKHVFGDAALPSGHTMYDLALDYLTILYRFPTQGLPIICLVNSERNTGKSTFLWFLKALFQDNTTFIGSEDLKDNFNDDWASKLIIGIDEGFIDKKTVLEKIKSMSTAPSIKMRGMYQGRQEIPFFGKFVLTSNDDDNFIMIDENETRFLVIKVPVLKFDDPDMIKKLEEEVSAFLHHLATRDILHPKKSRHWFESDLLITDALKNVRKNSKGWGYSELTTILEEKFLHYRWPTLYYNLEEIAKMLNGEGSAVKFRKHDIRMQLKNKFKLAAIMGRYDFPEEPNAQSQMGQTYSKHGRMYEFRIENFFTEDELRGELKEIFDFDKIKASRATVPVLVAVEDDLPF